LSNFNVLRGKKFLVVDDEPDILDTIKEILAEYDVTTATDYDTASKLIKENDFDLAILDIMGVNGFALLEACRNRKIPATMLTSRALNLESINLAIRLGAVSFLPKTELDKLPELIAEILDELEKGRTHWEKLFVRMEDFFKERLGVLWEELEKPPKVPPFAY